MPSGKKIAEDLELEKFVIDLLKKGCTYEEIIRRAKDQCNKKIDAYMLSGYIKNYLPPEVVLPKQKRGRPRKDIEKGIVPTGEGETPMKGDKILNEYAISLDRIEEQIVKLIKRKMNEDEMKNFISLTNLKNKLHQQIVKQFSGDIRKREMKNFCADILELVGKVFGRVFPQEEKLVYQDFGKRLLEGMDIIFMKWFGEKM